MISPLLNEPALIVENNIRTLVIADIHLGIEWELYHSGISIPSQVEKRTARIMEYISKAAAFLKNLAGFAPVDIVPGNHDGDIEELIPENVTMHSMRGFVLDSAGYFHGHTWPDADLLSVSHVIMSHNHPAIRLTDALGHGVSEPVWIRTRFIEKAIREHYGKIEDWRDPEVVIMPAFNELSGGIPFNESIHEELLGPIFANHAIELEKARAFLLDGTDIGTIEGIKKLGITRVRRKYRKKSIASS